MNEPDRRWNVGLVGRELLRSAYLGDDALAQLDAFADFRFFESDLESSWDKPPEASPHDLDELKVFVTDLDALIVCHGSPRITAEVMDRAPHLKLIGELEGDRFAQRIDVEEASRRGVAVVDTTHGSSYPVAEWALGLTLVGLNNAGSLFRRLISGEEIFASRAEREADPVYRYGELTGKRVGLIGCGYIGRRLIELLRPFQVDLYVHDPYVPNEIADIYDLTLTSLEQVLTGCDVVICLVPLTPGTKGLLGRKELGMLRSGAVLVNVSRGAVIDTSALIDRLREGDVIACLDVFDPEPIPADSPVRSMHNVFLTPHIAGVTAAGRMRFFSLMVDEIERVFRGHRTRHDLSPRVVANRTGTPPDS
ncbi:phosphoglycerate dehydrogenase-like enzyme [Ilumatobacter fluminis]|uniref:Phosphoglycerate dehydrogenase-like enzyme n=1 Tax=Ilumatobacter fluminis TaxID=467091 RepID=A0A4R7HXH7_9ACTN|nr:NAD(P)-dependent oxidoreductase [Ilumatobacter fluminis]TDT14916.1 phosphoglycerate dehydrogenase-like enzyme [Ilumatobacter fluminis]